MLKEERFEHVLAVLRQNQKVTYELLAQELDVSEDTIRRDIEWLHRNGLLTKVRGGAILRSMNPLSFQDRVDFLTDGKNIIARKSQLLIKTGMTLFMDGGTTICTIAAHFPVDAQFRVITNNIALMPILSRHPRLEVILLGGSYNRDTETTAGIQTCLEAARFTADLYLMGACAIDKHYGVSASLQDESELKKIMLASSLKKAVVSNREKLESIEPFKVCQLRELNYLITDIASDDTRLDGYRNRDVDIM